jgi:uncharacterized iron-regulated protein
VIRPPVRAAALPALAALLAACAPAAAPAVTAAPVSAPSTAAGLAADVRVHGADGATVPLAAMLDAVAAADVVFVGEQHDDPLAHRVELELLRELARRGRRVVLSLEMFERDVQPLVDAYLAGRLPEARLLADGRPWPNYATDYRPLVELARAQGWPVVAANVPRALANAVARGGLAARDPLPPDRRRLAAAELRCPDDAYRRKFVAQMAGMGSHGAHAPPAADSAAAAAARAAAATLHQRYYEAQCTKDETMAESVAAALAPDVTVVHVNGSFHSDEWLGTADRVRRRRPDVRGVVISVVRGTVDDVEGLGDFVVRSRE